MKNLHLILGFLLYASTLSFSQQLDRKGWFAARLNPVTQAETEALKLKTTEGLKIVQIAGGTSKALNLQVDDVVLTINNQKFASAKDIGKYMTSQKENAPISVEISRGGNRQTLNGKVVGRPRETDANADVIYESVPYKSGKLSIIINKPRKSGKLPAVLFIPGYTCSSADGLRENDPYARIVHAFSAAGYVVMRVEKSGLGDCENTPECSSTDLKAEVENFEAGLKKLQSLDYVDTANVFLFGHSMGGIVAPAIAAKNNVRGLMVYGTVLNSWFEFQQQMNRLQFQLTRPEPFEYERKCRIQTEIMHEFYIEKKSLVEISKNSEKLKELQADWEYDGKDVIWGRNMEYWRQIQDFPLLDNWKNTKAKVLVLFGGADIQAFSKDEHERVVYTVNYFHPNNAEMITFPETDHLFAKVGTQQKSSDLLIGGKFTELFEAFDFEVTQKSIEWANKQVVK
jgi:uncharacterized protein